jgi:hypothetical protein
MSFAGRRTYEAPPPPPLLYAAKGVKKGAPLKEVLTRVSEGHATAEAGAEALRVERLELQDATVSTAASYVLDYYHKAYELVFTNVHFEGDAFNRMCNGIAQSKDLRTVSLTRCGVTDEQARELVCSIAATKIVAIDLSHNALVSPVEAIERLKRHQPLQSLDVSGNKLSEECVEVLEVAAAGHWPNLTSLSADDKSIKAAVKDGNKRLTRAAVFK